MFKYHFAKNILIPQLEYSLTEKNFYANVQYLSSDAIRQEILGYNYNKYDEIMMESSGQAFRLLEEKLKMATSYPVNAEFIVVDTGNLLPGKKVLISPNWIKNIVWSSSEVTVNATIASVKNSPEYDPSQELTDEYVAGLQKYYETGINKYI